MNKTKRVYYLSFLIIVILWFYYPFWKGENYIEDYIEVPIVNKNKTQCNIINKSKQNKKYTIDSVDFPKYTYLHQNESINFDCLNRTNERRLILVWTPYFKDKTFGYGLGHVKPFEKHNCPVTNCELTNERKRISNSHAVIMHIPDLVDLPNQKNRNEHQKWIFWLHESPANTNKYTKYNHLFNWSVTYESSSDFPGFYETQMKFKWNVNQTWRRNTNYLENKLYSAAILVSNCKSFSNRLNIVKKIQEFIDVKVYGSCGEKCPEDEAKEAHNSKNSSSLFKNIKTSQCLDYITKNFKFYLSFENSICEDYITEKFFNILNYDIIPVVFGGGTYSDYVIIINKFFSQSRN
jgi:alpha-1,3-fucosyltransferase